MINTRTNHNSEKKTAIQIVNESRKELVDDLIQRMEEGKIPWRQEWSNCNNIPHNPLSKIANNGYHGGNRIRLMITAMSEGYSDPRWVTAKQAMDAGMHVKKGEHGVLLEKWIYGMETERVNPDTNEVEKVFQPFREPKVNFFRVFNAEQIEGMEPLSQYMEKFNQLDVTKEADLDEVIENLHASSECTIVNEYGNRAFYRPATDEIYMPMLDQFESKVAYIGTLSHEMSHSTGHESRMNRPFVNIFGTEDYAREELRAELGAIFTMQSLGVPITEPSFDNHSAYIQNWISVLKTDYNELFKACNDADKISTRLMDNYEKALGHGHDIEQEITEYLDIEKMHKNGVEDLYFSGKITGDGLFREKDVMADDYSAPVCSGKCRITEIQNGVAALPNSQNAVYVELEGGVNLALTQSEFDKGYACEVSQDIGKERDAIEKAIDGLDDCFCAAFMLDNGDYLAVTVTEGYSLDYTMYSPDYREIDGGQLDVGRYSNNILKDNFRELCNFIGIQPKSMERVNEEELDIISQEVAEKDLNEKRSAILGDGLGLT